MQKLILFDGFAVNGGMSHCGVSVSAASPEEYVTLLLIT